MRCLVPRSEIITLHTLHAVQHMTFLINQGFLHLNFNVIRYPFVIFSDIANTCAARIYSHKANIYTHILVHTYNFTYLCTYTHICTNTHTHIHVHINIPTHTYTSNPPTHVHVNVNKYAHTTYTCIRIYKYIILLIIVNLMMVL